jgi:MFS family permease
VTRPYHALRHAEFRRVWLSQLVSQVGSQMQSVALHWHVYLLTGSPLALGAMGLTRALPTALFSLWGGVVADRRDRRLVMLAAQSGMTLVALALAALTLSGRETLLALYLLNALGAAAGAFDNPSRQALIPRLVPLSSLPGALAMNLAMFQTALIGGPALAGLLIAGHAASGLAGAASAGAATSGTGAIAMIYAINAVSFLGVLGVLATLRTSGQVEAPAGGVHEPPLAALREGLRFVLTTPVMVWSTGLDFVATFFDRRVRPRDRRLRSVALLRAHARRAGRHRPRRPRLDGDPPDAAPAAHAGSPAGSHDRSEHDVLHRRTPARGGGGGPGRVAVRLGGHGRHRLDRVRWSDDPARCGRRRRRDARHP